MATWCRIDDVEIGPLPNLQLNLKMSWTPNVKHYSNSKTIIHSYELTTQITSRESIPCRVVHFVALILFSEESDILLVLKLKKFLSCGLIQHNHSHISVTEM